MNDIRIYIKWFVLILFYVFFDNIISSTSNHLSLLCLGIYNIFSTLNQVTVKNQIYTCTQLGK